MLKSNFKLIALIIVAILLLIPFSYASDFVNGDLYVSADSEYNFSSTLDGSAFVNSDSFILDSSHNGGVVKGNLFVLADEVKISSDINYINENNDTSSANIAQINSSSIIYGNTFVLAKKFTMEAGTEINGDLFILANEININSKATVYGNVFATTSNFNLNGSVANNVYANAKTFNMGYDGIINKTLNLSAESVNINGLISKDCNVSANSITTQSDFVNYGNIDFSAETITFAGEIGKVASPSSVSLKAKNINIDNLTKLNIIGNLNYSTSKEIYNLQEAITGEISYSEYSKASTNNSKSFLDYFVDLISKLVFVLVIYFISTKVFKLSLANKNFTLKKLLVSLGIGIILLIAVPILFIILCMIHIGIALAFTLLAVYVLIILLAIPSVIFLIAKLLHDKLNSKISIPAYIIIATCVLWILQLIPGLKTILSILLLLIGSGNLFVKMIKKN